MSAESFSLPGELVGELKSFLGRVNRSIGQISLMDVSLDAKALLDQLEIQTSPVSRLSPREWQVFRLLGQGRVAKEIASELCMTVKTVHAHQATIRHKLGLASVRQLIMTAVRHMDKLREGGGQ